MMKKTLVALASLSAMAGAAQAQSSVTLYGIVDAAVRYTTNHGAGEDSLTKMVGGGMSQSRWGINVNEDLGGGLRAVANLENRFLADNGANASIGGGAWSQSWVGLQSSQWGRITLGRQYNVIFDVTTSTFASFKYSPYIEAYKPEIALSMGARNDNMVKYALTVGGFTGELQVSAGEGTALGTANPIGGKSYGGMAKYVWGPFAVGGAYIEREDTTGLKANGYVLGAAYTSGNWYVSGGYAVSEFDQGFNSALVMAGSGYDNTFAYPAAVGGAAANLNVDNRSLWYAGFTYQMTPAFNIGAAYWAVEQEFHTAGLGKPKADFFAVIADYAFSKRTDAYVGFDFTKIDGPLLFSDSPSDDRTGFMVGLRHRF